ncbi:hypothetical protein MRB53_017818 [Persea americana]|uniref:Uncharacterized protein n=1 Tax=Persea americana TaxID=3435 RepID=A0ACC2M622_PERAE|nr:hypothetical protein MRB53_017818 [Persea americana]
MSRESVSVDLCKAINGLEKVVLREVRGSSAEPPKAICGGIPICFPQFSSHGALEQHGFARNKIRRFDTDSPHFPTNSSNKAFVDLILRPSEDDTKIWSHSYKFCLRVALGTEQGDALTFESEVDKIYVSTPTKIAILDHEKMRTFFLWKDGLPDAAVWNPWDRKAKKPCLTCRPQNEP